MTSAAFAQTPIPIRADLRAALARSWTRLGEPGAWLDGATRVQVAAEARQAWDCALCRRRKEALSPHAIEGDHDALGRLPESWIEVIHRVVTDSGRITERWYQAMRERGVGEEEFVELVSVAVLATVVDAFALGIGMAAPALPQARAGEPARQRPGNVTPGPGWVSTIPPERAGPEIGEFYARGAQHIKRALTLVPEETHRFWDLMYPLYLPDPTIVELEGAERAISRAQMEFIAARVSALLDCFY
jgi:hypothetical protein